ncbi:hypothetical protein BZA05DRAFT_18962 [Tricharina praecox]|uniref:uncharacterized protein n=1 Tax=Tricharina praecox TaxID=43433 RepID=UPI002220F339|nr:uncharacterized protein BZA05DRAFT_18962 [Tricharina praecox]KAI5858976.1 hypothetical protein BZA05DRAFT_18962 [Tricharina praecox]
MCLPFDEGRWSRSGAESEKGGGGIGRENEYEQICCFYYFLLYLRPFFLLFFPFFLSVFFCNGFYFYFFYFFFYFFTLIAYRYCAAAILPLCTLTLIFPPKRLPLIAICSTAAQFHFLISSFLHSVFVSSGCS